MHIIYIVAVKNVFWLHILKKTIIIAKLIEFLPHH